MRIHALTLLALIVASTLATPAAAERKLGAFGVKAEEIACCAEGPIEAIIWSGVDSLMTIEELASYAGPVLWFSPDEPLLRGTSGVDMRIPEAFPFEEAPDAPVVYYRVRKVVADANQQGDVYAHDDAKRGQSMLILADIGAIDLDFFFYYSMEEGLGGHEHDVESVQMQIIVWRRPECDTCPFNLVVSRVTGKAHGLLWYDNTLAVDEYTEFPIHILVEEGKHASCTDKNGDGYFTPGYDVNQRVNDAWGVRDVLRTGRLSSAGYQAWMSKVRQPEHRVFPPLPPDSPRAKNHTEAGIYAPENAIYEVRPFPSADKADEHLVHFIADKGPEDWPELAEASDLDQLLEVIDTDTFVKSLSIAYRADGSQGISFVFPLFIVKNFEDPLAGGFVVNRIYFQDKNLRDFGWNLLYTLSASRWMDPYISGGYEGDVEDAPAGSPDETVSNHDFVMETGFKFRANVKHSPMSFLSSITDFWGLRLGMKYKGFWDVGELSYVVEIGAGTW
jgi:hypothetical protein